LKKRLKLTKDFSFSFREAGSGEIPELSVSRITPGGVEAISKEFPVIVMKYTSPNSIEFKELIFNLKVW
jgi:hypothetical protein